MLDSPQQAPFFLLRCNSGKSKCHASQGHLCSHPAWTPLVPNTSTIHSWYPVWHQRHLVSRLCHHPSSQIHLCSPALCAHCVCKSIPCDEVAVRIAHDIGISFCRLSGSGRRGCSCIVNRWVSSHGCCQCREQRLQALFHPQH